MLKIKYSTTTYDTKGDHVVCDLYGLPYNVLNIDYIEFVASEAITISGATKLGTQISDNSIIFLLSESHLSFHFVENNALIDFFTCGSCNPRKGIEYLISCFRPEKHYIEQMQRGIVEYSTIQ